VTGDRNKGKIMAAKSISKKAALAEIVRDVQFLGELREKMGSLKASERLVGERLEAAMLSMGVDRAQSAEFAAQLAESTRLVVEAGALRAELGDEARFIECVRVDITAARRVIGERLEAIGQTTRTVSLRVSRRPDLAKTG
jgi:hypothetical protein